MLLNKRQTDTKYICSNEKSSLMRPKESWSKQTPNWGEGPKDETETEVNNFY